MRDNRDIIQKLDWLATDMEEMEVPGDWLLPVTEARSIIFRLREEVERLQKIAAAATPKPLDDTAPKNRVLIGVERPPFEEKTYYDMVRWVEERQDWMIPRGWNFDKRKWEFARSGVSHYLDPLELPGLPYWEGKDDEEDADV
jgi:hypothetical protein